MIRRFWAYEVGRPENFFSFQLGQVLVRRFRKYLDGKRVVDFGAGGGYLVEDLISAGIQCGAVDFEAATLNTKLAHPLFLGARTPEHLQEWEGSFDVTFLIEVVEHLYDKQLDECLVQIKSLLRAGGVLIVTTPNEEDRSRQFLISPESGLFYHRFQHVRSWDAESLANRLRQSDFHPLEIGKTDFGASRHALKRTRSAGFRRLRSMAKTLFDRRTPHLYAVAIKS